MKPTKEELEHLAQHRRTTEAMFRDKEKFANYIADEVNPARLKEGLSVISNSAANVCYDLIMQRRYLA